jgi:hypothetical protein
MKTYSFFKHNNPDYEYTLTESEVKDKFNAWIDESDSNKILIMHYPIAMSIEAFARGLGAVDQNDMHDITELLGAR